VVPYGRFSVRPGYVPNFVLGYEMSRPAHNKCKQNSFLREPLCLSGKAEKNEKINEMRGPGFAPHHPGQPFFKKSKTVSHLGKNFKLGYNSTKPTSTHWINISVKCHNLLINVSKSVSHLGKNFKLGYNSTKPTLTH
jgi:hypothetical protein